MAKTLIEIIVFSIVSACLVPLSMLALARFRFLPPISFIFLNKEWSFPPKPKQVTASTSATLAEVFPRHLVLASAVTTVLSITSLDYFQDIQETIATGSNGTHIVRDVVEEKSSAE
ncbi:MAG: hypothetical protein ACLP7P_16615 [Rhodomicrobium sp.]